MRAITLLVFVLVFLTFVDGAKILAIFPFPARSHYILGSALMRALAEHGHDVTVISCFGEKDPPKGGKYRDIRLDEVLGELERQKNSVNMYEMGDMGPFINIPFLAHMLVKVNELTFIDKNVQELIHSGEKFDVVIIEQFMNDLHKVLATHFNGIQVIFSTMGPNFWVNSLVGNPSPLAYVPDIFLSYSPNMNFCERLTNTLVYAVNVIVHQLYLYPIFNKYISQHIPNPPKFEDALYNASLVLLNSHPSLNQAMPKVPNMIEIGGFHVKPPKKLPKDLQEFLDNAEHGVIYFSMGSNLKSAELPITKRDALLKVFSKLKQKILWKWEEDVLPGQPPNVKLAKWFPQQEILAHPNVKLFITHGGLLSTTETIYFGVPVLAIPIFGDQKLNAQTAVSGGYGLSLAFPDLSETNLENKLNELLNNPKYGDNAKIRSKVFHDRPVKPMDTALYWIDYVIRHGGAPHLKVAATDIPWYQYFLLDVLAFILLVILIALYVTKFCFKKLCNKLCTKKKTEKLKKK